MADFLILVTISVLILLLVATSLFPLSIVDLIATEKTNLKQFDNILYTRHILEFPSEILWVNSKSNEPQMNKNIETTSLDRKILLVTQTTDGNIHTLDIDTDVPNLLQSKNHSSINTYDVNASVDTGGPITTDLNNDSNFEIISTTANGSLVVIDSGKNSLMLYDDTKLSNQTPVVPYLDKSEGESKLIGVSENGTLLMIRPIISNTSKLALKGIETNFTNLLTDGRLVVGNIDNNNSGDLATNEILALADPVDLYPHASLGDPLEPTRLLLIEHCHNSPSKNSNVLCLKNTFTPPEGMEVFETILPVILEIWNETVTSKGVGLVASDISVGSAAHIYGETSSLLFSSKPIGQGFRWLLILGSVATINNDQSASNLLVINETPHLSGIVKFIDIKNNKTLEIEGFSAHDYGSRNVGMYAITDVDNDGQDDLIIPNLDKKKIAILSIFDNNDTIYVSENFELNDRLSSNIITLDINYDNYQDIIAGDRSGNLYIFTSQVK